MSNGSNGKVPGSKKTPMVYAVGLTVEEIKSLVAGLDKILGESHIRNGLGCEIVTELMSVRVLLEHRLEGRT